MVNVLRMLSLRGIELYTFTATRDQLTKSLGEKSDSLQITGTSIVAASLAGTLLITPLEYIKTINSITETPVSSAKLFY